MKRSVLIIAGVLVLLYVAAIFTPFDPQDRRPGTLLSGELAEDQNSDWSFMAEREQAFVETRSLYGVRHSITVSSWSDDGKLYVGCRACDGKYWPKNVARDPRVRMKIRGELYELTAFRLDDNERRSVLEQKFGLDPNEPLPDIAVFRMDPETQG